MRLVELENAVGAAPDAVYKTVPLKLPRDEGLLAARKKLTEPACGWYKPTKSPLLTLGGVESEKWFNPTTGV